MGGCPEDVTVMEMDETILYSGWYYICQVQRRMILDSNLHKDPEAAVKVREFSFLATTELYNLTVIKSKNPAKPLSKLASNDDMVNRRVILH